MAQLTLITGLTQFKRQTRIRQILQGSVKTHPPPPDYIYLVPTKRKVKYTEEWLLKQNGKAWSPSVYTLNRLAVALYLKLGGNKRLINEFARQLILQSLLTDSTAKWKFFTPDQLNPGLIKSIADFIAKAKTYCHDDLDSAIHRYRLPVGLQAKDHDLLNLYKSYCRSLNQKNLMDSQDILTEAVRLLEKEGAPGHPLQKIRSLVIDGFYYFKPLEERFIKTVIKIFDQVVVSIDSRYPPSDENHPLINKYLDFWQKLGARPGHTLDFSSAETTTVSAPELTICSLPKRYDEVKAIARNIRQIMSQHPGVNLADIYVVFPGMDIYAPLVHELFPRYGIPYEITKGYPLRSSPVSGTVLKLLAIKLDGYLRDDWCALFASGLVGYSATINEDEWSRFINSLEDAPSNVRQLLACPPAGEQQLNMPLIDYWLRRANIRGGANWQQDWLAPLLKIIKISGLDKEGQTELYLQLCLLYKAWAEFECLPASLTSAEFMRGLLSLISRFRLPLNIVQIHNNRKRDEQIIIKRELKALDKLNSLLKQMVSAFGLAGKDKAKKTLAEFQAMFLNYLTTEEYYPTDYTEDRVQIVETLELRGLYFEYLFWGGLLEEEFPRPEPRELFYPASKIRGLFKQLPRLAEDRYLFSYIFKNTRRKICLSYPAGDQGKPRLPSPFIDEGKRVIDQDVDTLKSSSTSTCYTRQELLCHVAADWDKGLPALTMLKVLKKRDTGAYYQLLHLLELEGLRKSGTAFSPYEGVLALPANQLKPHTHYAVTQLEDYAHCPLGYFFKYILKLTPVEEIIDDYKAPDRGSLLHKILEDFYRLRIKKYSPTFKQIKITPANLEEASRQMLGCAGRVLCGFHTKYDNLFWENEKQNLISGLTPQDNPQPPGLLRSFLEYEAQLPDRLIPRYVEFRFGKDTQAPALKLDGISLKGRVDRIDLSPDEGIFIVYDYKFGSVPSGLLIKQGLSFQLPVYMLAVAEFLKASGCTIGAGGYYQIRSSHKIGKTNYFGKDNMRAQSPKDLNDKKPLVSRQRFGFLTDAEFLKQIEQVKTRLAHIHQLITAGRFHPPLGDEDALSCSFCDYARICRVDTVRLAKMYAGLNNREYYKPLLGQGERPTP